MSAPPSPPSPPPTSPAGPRLRRRGRRLAAVAGLAAAGVVALAGWAARGGAQWGDSTAAPRRELPFGIGERLEYDAKVGPLRVGRGHMEVVAMEPVRGQEALHISFRVSGGALGIRVTDAMDSWVDPRTFSSVRFIQELEERGKERDRRYEIYPDRGVYSRNGEPEQPSVARPLDEGALFYYVRTLPLTVGETYELDRYFRPDRNPVRIRVLRRERVKVPAGEFDAIVIQPIIKAKGLFAESRRTELWLSDDGRRILLKMQSQLPFGSLSLHLRRATPAPTPLIP